MASGRPARGRHPDPHQGRLFDDWKRLRAHGALHERLRGDSNTGPVIREGQAVVAADHDVALEPTPDILAGLGTARRPGQVLIGFAAEHGEGGADRARLKLERKGADMIVMNDISRRDIGFDSDHNELTLVTSDREIGVSRRSKRACAAAIWDAVSLPARTAADAVRA
jgi:phosphopantothenoylcysteine decarboxylase/phosphopantothenate--cysteine ligase